MPLSHDALAQWKRKPTFRPTWPTLVNTPACGSNLCLLLQSLGRYRFGNRKWQGHGSITKYCRSNAKLAESAMDLTPPAFDKNIPFAGVIVSGSNPDCMGTWRFLPLTRLPIVGIPVPAVIPADPHMLAARTCRTLFMDADWRTKLYHDGRVNGHYPKSKAKQRRKNKFSHFSSPDAYTSKRMAVYVFSILQSASGRLKEKHNSLCTLASMICLARG